MQREVKANFAYYSCPPLSIYIFYPDFGITHHPFGYVGKTCKTTNAEIMMMIMMMSMMMMMMTMMMMIMTVMIMKM